MSNKVMEVQLHALLISAKDDNDQQNKMRIP